MKILLNDYMAKNNYTTRQVSIMTGVPRSTINDIANGKSSPTMDVMERLAMGMKTRISDLYESEYK